MSTPFAGRPGAQSSFDAIRGGRREPDTTDLLGAHQNQLEDLNRRVTALEAQDDEQEGAA